MKLLTISALLCVLSITQLQAGGVPSPGALVKKTVELDSRVMTVTTDFSLNGLGGAQNIEVRAINRHLDDNVAEFRDGLIKTFHTRHTSSPSTPRFTFVGLDHPFFSIFPVFLKDFDYKSFNSKVMNHMFSHKLPLVVSLEFFDRRLKASLANISLPRDDRALTDNIFENVISKKGKVKLLLRSNLVFATSSRTKCIVSVKNHFNLIDLQGNLIEGNATRTFDFGVDKSLSKEIQSECKKLGLAD